ncbi:MAG TPA: hypothetical protein VGE92_01555, partial [Steroidobacteraceae bacterium]
MPATLSTPFNRRLSRQALFLRALIIGAAAYAAHPAHANDATAEAAEPAAAGGLEEIVVTATRHEESMSKVAISISAYTKEDMDVKGVKDISDIVRFT